MFNRFAKRDPQLYPLAAIMLAVTGTAGYFLMHKGQTSDPAKAFGQVTGPWEAKDGGKVAEWKYRYKTQKQQGEMPNAMNEQVRELNWHPGDISHSRVDE